MSVSGCSVERDLQGAISVARHKKRKGCAHVVCSRDPFSSRTPVSVVSRA